MTVKDYAVVSLHEKGFWQIDIYFKMDQPPIEGDVPDHFKTCAIGQPMAVATQWVTTWHSGAEVLIEDEDEDEDEETAATSSLTSPNLGTP